MLSNKSENTANEKRRALAKIYILLVRLVEEDKQSALSDNFGEKTEKAEEQTPTNVEACDD